MNKRILNKLTFGFELEGYFHKDIEIEVAGEFKEDGSVHIDNPFDYAVQTGGEECHECGGTGTCREDCDCICTVGDDHSKHNCEYPCDTDSSIHDQDCGHCDGTGNFDGVDANEFASKVFDTLPELQAELQQFTKKNYAYGEGCGFHLHIGTQDDKSNTNRVKLFNVASNYEFLVELRKTALKFCKCQRDRLKLHDNHYYEMFAKPSDLIYDFKRVHNTDAKYRFLRFHPYHNTLEFRFLCPCWHKVENATKVIDILTDYLAKNSIIEAKQEIDDKLLTTPRIDSLKLVLELLTPVEAKAKAKNLKAYMKRRLSGYNFDTWDLTNPTIKIIHDQSVEDWTKGWELERQAKNKYAEYFTSPDNNLTAITNNNLTPPIIILG